MSGEPLSPDGRLHQVEMVIAGPDLQLEANGHRGEGGVEQCNRLIFELLQLLDGVTIVIRAQDLSK